MQYIKIKNWVLYQTLGGDRQSPMPWFKMHRSFFTDYHVMSLSEENRFKLIGLYSLCDHESGVLKKDENEVKFKLRCESFSFDDFEHFFEPYDPSEPDVTGGNSEQPAVTECCLEESRKDKKRSREDETIIEEDKTTSESDDNESIEDLWINPLSTSTSTSLDLIDKTDVRRNMFEELWYLFPAKSKKCGRDLALQSWNRLNFGDEITSEMFDLIKDCLNNHSASQDWANEQGKYIPFATKWLDEKRWENKLAKAKTESLPEMKTVSLMSILSESDDE